MSKQFTFVVVATLLSWTVSGNPIIRESFRSPSGGFRSGGREVLRSFRSEGSEASKGFRYESGATSGDFRYESGETPRDFRYEIGKTRERPPVDPMKERYYKFVMEWKPCGMCDDAGKIRRWWGGQTVCPACHGIRSVPIACPKCDGDGYILRFWLWPLICPACMGNGRVQNQLNTAY